MATGRLEGKRQVQPQIEREPAKFASERSGQGEPEALAAL